MGMDVPAPILVKVSTGGGLDRVGFGFIFDDLLGSSSWRRPPPMGLFSKVPNADSALNSHLIIVSLTAKIKLNQFLKVKKSCEIVTLERYIIYALHISWCPGPS